MNDDNVEQNDRTRTALPENRDYRISRNPDERSNVLKSAFDRVRSLVEPREAEAGARQPTSQVSVAQPAADPATEEMTIGIVSVDLRVTGGIDLVVVGLQGRCQGVRSTLQAPDWMPAVKPGDRVVMETVKMRTPEGGELFQFTRCVRVEQSTGDAYDGGGTDPGAKS